MARRDAIDRVRRPNLLLPASCPPSDGGSLPQSRQLCRFRQRRQRHQHPPTPPTPSTPPSSPADSLLISHHFLPT